MVRPQFPPPSTPSPRERAALDFVGVGAARCGTTWLARCLGEHPSIFIPARKELKYFDNDFLYDPSLRVLRRAFAGARPDQRRGELSPRYLASSRALRRLAAACPDVKVLVNLREPVDRLFSDFCFYRFNMKQEPHATLEAALRGRFGDDYLRRSLYAGQLALAFELFGRDRVHVIIFDDISRRPDEVLRAAFAFLGVDAAFSPRSAGAVVNRSVGDAGAPRRTWACLAQWIAHGANPLTRLTRPFLVPLLNCGHGVIDACVLLQDHSDPPHLDEGLRERLYREIFREDVERTERLLGRDLSSWKR